MSDATVNMILFGFEGEIHDYLLTMRYITIQGEIDVVLENDILTLKSLIESFSPTAVIDQDRNQIMKNAKHVADQQFNNWISANGKEIFKTQLYFEIHKLRMQILIAQKS